MTSVVENNNAEMSQIASEITARIKQLESLMDESLRDEMQSLKVALLENPAACSLLLEEDIGLLVKNLRRTVSAAVIEASKPKTREKKEKTKFTAEQLQAALDEEF